MERDRFFSAEQAVEYGLVDRIVTVAGASTELGRASHRRGSDPFERLSRGLTPTPMEEWDTPCLRRRPKKLACAPNWRVCAPALRTCSDVARIGTWERDMSTGAVDWSEELKAMLVDLSPGPNQGIDSWLDIVHPDDRPRVDRAHP